MYPTMYDILLCNTEKAPLGSNPAEPSTTKQGGLQKIHSSSSTAVVPYGEGEARTNQTSPNGHTHPNQQRHDKDQILTGRRKFLNRAAIDTATAKMHTVLRRGASTSWVTLLHSRSSARDRTPEVLGPCGSGDGVLSRAVDECPPSSRDFPFPLPLPEFPPSGPAMSTRAHSSPCAAISSTEST